MSKDKTEVTTATKTATKEPESAATRGPDTSKDTELLVTSFELLYRCFHSLLKGNSPTKFQIRNHLDSLRARLGATAAELEKTWR